MKKKPKKKPTVETNDNDDDDDEEHDDVKCLDTTSGASTLRSLLAMSDEASFINDYWEKQPLLIRRNDDAEWLSYVRKLFSLEQLKKLLSTSNHRFQYGRDLNLCRLDADGRKQSLNKKAKNAPLKLEDVTSAFENDKATIQVSLARSLFVSYTFRFEHFNYISIISIYYVVSSTAAFFQTLVGANGALGVLVRLAGRCQRLHNAARLARSAGPPRRHRGVCRAARGHQALATLRAHLDQLARLVRAGERAAPRSAHSRHHAHAWRHTLLSARRCAPSAHSTQHRHRLLHSYHHQHLSEIVSNTYIYNFLFFLP